MILTATVEKDLYEFDPKGDITGGVIPMVSPSVCCIDAVHRNRSSCSGSFKMAEKIKSRRSSP